VTVVAKQTLVAGDGFSVTDVRCLCAEDGWSEPEEATAYGVVFVRSGCFRRESEGVEAVLDPACAYFEVPARIQRIAHPHGLGDRCTGIELAPDLLASVFDGRLDLPVRPVYTSPETDLAHRRLLARAYRAAEPLEVEEDVVAVVAGALGHVDEHRVAAGRPATAALRRRLVDGARELILVDPRIALVALGRRLAVSPHHLSRVFVAETGETISRYRNRIRARIALERIADGEASLARIAADLSFADHAHLTRVVRREVGRTPSDLRDLLRFGA
jgi:AraC-like DNA-binding protein